MDGLVSTKSPNGVKRGGFLGLLLAPNGHADRIVRCPLLGCRAENIGS
jgi:hypothetical protein